MTPNDRKRVYRRELILASAIVAGGLVVTSLSLAQLATHPEFGQATTHSQMAQATQPLQSTPGAENKPSAPAPASSETTGARPTEVSPQPARPNADAQDAGAKPALPPAPAEKTAAPINAK